MTTCGDLVKKAVFAEIERKAKTFANPPLTEAERKKKLDDIEAALAENWYAIELGYRAAKAEGHDVTRPARMPPEAVLLILEDDKPRKAKIAGDANANTDDDDPRLEKWAAAKTAEWLARKKKLDAAQARRATKKSRTKSDWLG
jgi:hypothetical protein